MEALLKISGRPEGRACWTVRLVAEEAVKRKLVPKVGRETVRLLLLHHDLKPRRDKEYERRSIANVFCAWSPKLTAASPSPLRIAPDASSPRWRSVWPDLKLLKSEIRAWNRRMNRDRVRVKWPFGRNDARRKLPLQIL